MSSSHNQTDYLELIYSAINALEAGIETLRKDHDFSAQETTYPAVAIDFNDRIVTKGDLQQAAFRLQILVLVKIDPDNVTPIPTAREKADDIVQAIEGTFDDGIEGFHHPERIETSFGFAEDGTIALYLALMNVTTNYVR